MTEPAPHPSPRATDPDVEAESVVEAGNAVRVEVYERFAARLSEDHREALFIRDDMHCNDAGYALMAEIVAESLR